MIPVILSGGSGSRLWPVSRAAYPKQFADLLDESLYSKTLRRLKTLGSPWTITVSDLRVLTEKTLKEQGLPLDQVILEPSGKNTAPAVALLCHIFASRGMSDEIVGIFPADHLIEDDEKFLACVRAGESLAARGEVITLGIKPSYPATGYGYIETDSKFDGKVEALRAIGFREKPNESTARDFLERGGFYWNAGMFIFRISRMIELLKTHAPDVWTVVSETHADLSNLKEVYARVRAISFDYAVMERLVSHVCIPCTFGWSDLGSWDAMAEALSEGNKEKSHQIEVDASSNFVFPVKRKTYAFVGVEDLIVVDTEDALLVSRKGASERVKDIVDGLKKDAHAAATEHRFEVRPWGRFEILRDSDEFKSKIIVVDPGTQLSYQSHEKRSEHWIIVSGSGEVVLNDEIIPVTSGQYVYIPVGAKHRIRNNSSAPLHFFEVQVGSYFGEDDIIRYQDDYKR